MTMSKDWYNTEFEENELESKHRPPSVEYSFYTAVKTGDMETVIQNCNANSFYSSGRNRHTFQKCGYQS